MLKKALTGLLFIILAAVTIVGCSTPPSTSTPVSPTQTTAQPQAAAFKMRLGHPNPPAVMGSKLMEMFGILLEARSGGRIKFEYFPSGTLGSPAEIIKQTQTGSIESCGAVGTPNLAPILPYIAALDLPFLFDNTMEATIWKGPARDMIDSDIEKTGMKIVAWSCFGPREMDCARKPLLTADDLKGLKWRVAPSVIMTKTWESWGAKPVTVSMGEVLTALQSGTIDGVGFDADTLITQKFTEVAKFVTLSGEIYTLSPIIVNKKWFDGLPKDLQDLTLQCAQIAGDWGSVSIERLRMDSVVKMKAQGCTINVLPAAEKAKLRDLAKPVYEYARSQYPKEFMDLLLAK